MAGRVACDRRERWRIRPAPISEVLSWRRIWFVLLNLFIISSALLTLFQTRHPSSHAMGLLRLAAGVAFLYTAAELVFEVCGLCFLVAGYSLPLIFEIRFFCRITSCKAEATRAARATTSTGSAVPNKDGGGGAS